MKPLNLFSGEGFQHKMLTAVRKAAEASYTKAVTQQVRNQLDTAIMRYDRQLFTGIKFVLSTMSPDAMRQRLRILNGAEKETGFPGFRPRAEIAYLKVRLQEYETTRNGESPMKPLAADFDDLIKQQCCAAVREHEGGDAARVTRRVVQKPLTEFDGTMKRAGEIAFDAAAGSTRVGRFREVMRAFRNPRLLSQRQYEQLKRELESLGYDPDYHIDQLGP